MSYLLKNLLLIVVLLAFTEHHSGNNFVQASLKKNKGKKDVKSSPKRPDDIHP